MLKKIRFRYQILMVCLLTSILSFIAVMEMLTMQHKQMTELYYKDTVELLEAESDKLSIKIKQVQRIATSLCLNSEFNDILSDYLQSTRQEVTTLEAAELSSIMSNFILNQPSISSIQVHTSKGDFYCRNYGLKKDVVFEDTGVAQLLNDRKGEKVFWGESMENEFYHQTGEVIPFVIRYRPYTESEYVDVIVLVRATRLLESQENKEDRLLIMNDGGRLVMGQEEALQEVLSRELGENQRQAGVVTVEYEKQNYMVMSVKVQGVAWYLIRFCPEDAVFGELQQMRSISLMVVVAVTGLSIVLSWMLSGTLTRPLVRLTQTCERVGQGDLSARFVRSVQPEIQNLGESFNRMLGQINQLIRELEEQKEWARIEQLLKRREELKSLQAQINPHFLYNTLESISWQALDVGAEDISDTIQSLANLFRTGLSQGKEMVPLKTELKNAVSYLEIQKKRYTKLFDYEIAVSEKYEAYYCVKMILQPLVENSIYHGLREKKERGGLIRIEIEESDNNFLLRVRDNGVGFEQNELETVNQQLKKRMIFENGSYGIYNVNERLKLYYGEAYGLHYEMDERGTCAILQFPMLKWEEVDKYVPYIGSR